MAQALQILDIVNLVILSIENIANTMKNTLRDKSPERDELNIEHLPLICLER